MSTSRKFYYHCVECHHKTSTTNAARAAAKVCVHCRPDLDAAPAKSKTPKAKDAPALRAKARAAAPAPESGALTDVVAQSVAETISIDDTNESVTMATPARKKPSALDAAARVLRETGTALSPKDIWMEIQQRGLWTSPKGRTPYATIASAMLREWKSLGGKSRFIKTDERGKFAANPDVA